MRSENSWLGALIEDWQNGGFGLYVHWPFCESKCPYCDFNSHVTAHIDHDEWAQSYLKEIDRVAALTPNRVLRSIYFGGGTPSLMEPATVASILDRAMEKWSAANDIEITLEANPSSVESHRFSGYAKAGVNRVSLGVQALNNDDLKRLGRLHDVSTALQAIETAKRHFDRVSFDLIYARQGQSLTAWEAELERAIQLAHGHLSLYQLTIEQGTAFGDRYNAGKLAGLPNDDLSADMFEITQQICAAHNLPAYEVSNHAAVGQESRHNIVYWQYGDYAGIGPGAHGRITVNGQKRATEAWSNPKRWLSAVQSGSGDKTTNELVPQDLGSEYLMMGLRLSDGVDVDRYQRLSGRTIDPETINELSGFGLVEMTGTELKTTATGRMVLNQVISKFLPD